MSESSYLEGLNPSQKEAVLHEQGPAMIIAGAGSGKTRVLTYRVARLMELGVDPYNILSLTFTNKAAREMRERIESVVGPEARSLWMGTFHSIFARILRAESEKLGVAVDIETAREKIYGMPYSEWKEKHQLPATPEQLAKFNELNKK